MLRLYFLLSEHDLPFPRRSYVCCEHLHIGKKKTWLKLLSSFLLINQHYFSPNISSDSISLSKIVFTCLFIYRFVWNVSYLIKLFDQLKFLPYLGNRNEGDEDNCHNEVDPEQPSKESEVGGHRRAEMRLDLFYAKLPWNQPRLKIHYLSTAILPFLYR